jgi:phosphoglycolate phosphatase-like HAD superfamily hydrolase
MTTVAVLTGPLGRSELEKKADIVLNSISEIPSLLQKL